MNLGGTRTVRINKFGCFILVFFIFLIIYWRTGGPSYPSETSDLVNLKTLLKAAIFAAERGGQRVFDYKDRELNMKSKGKTLEGANNPFTDADYASHCAMFYSLKRSFPKVNVVSEEHSEGDLECESQQELDLEAVPVGHGNIGLLNDEHVYAKDVTIWIDPLDATQEYSEKLYQYVTTMVCVAVRGVPIIGVIHFPFNHTSYWGWYTKTTSTNIPSIPYKKDNKEQPRVVISRSHAGKVSEHAKEAFGPNFKVTSAGGAGYKAMGVINGQFDVYFHTTAIQKWDICSGDAIIRAVGGNMTTAKGSPIDYSAGGEVRVLDGILLTRHDHDYYLSKMPKFLSA